MKLSNTSGVNFGTRHAVRTKYLKRIALPFEWLDPEFARVAGKRNMVSRAEDRFSPSTRADAIGEDPSIYNELLKGFLKRGKSSVENTAR